MPEKHREIHIPLPSAETRQRWGAAFLWHAGAYARMRSGPQQRHLNETNSLPDPLTGEAQPYTYEAPGAGLHPPTARSLKEMWHVLLNQLAINGGSIEHIDAEETIYTEPAIQLLRRPAQAPVNHWGGETHIRPPDDLM